MVIKRQQRETTEISTMKIMIAALKTNKSPGSEGIEVELLLAEQMHPY